MRLNHRKYAKEEKEGGPQQPVCGSWQSVFLLAVAPMHRVQPSTEPSQWTQVDRELSQQFYLVWVFSQQAFPWSLSYDFAWREWQVSKPVQLLITASSPAQPRSLAKDHKQLWSHSMANSGRVVSQQPCPNLKHSLQPFMSWEPKQQFQATSGHSPLLQTFRKPSQYPCLIANKIHTK